MCICTLQLDTGTDTAYVTEMAAGSTEATITQAITELYLNKFFFTIINPPNLILTVLLWLEA